MITKKFPRKILELNSEHSILVNLAKVYEKNNEDPFIESSVLQLFETALLQDGYLQDPHSLINHIQEMLATATELYANKKK